MKTQLRKFYLEIAVVLLVVVAFIIAVYFVMSSKTESVRVNLFLLWEPQAQFLGNYVAKDLGFFQDEGVDINIRHDLGVGNSMREILKEDQDNYVVSQFINVLDWLGYEPSVELVSIISRGCNLGWATATTKEEIMEILKKGSLYSWWGSEDILLRFILLSQNNDITNLTNRVTTQFPSVVTQNSAALVMAYNELKDFISIPERKVNFISYCEMGFPIFEDVLIGKISTDPQVLDLHKRVSRAMWKGWDWAVRHPKGAIDILMKQNPRLKRKRQEVQLEQFGSTLVQNDDFIESFENHINTTLDLINYDLIENSANVRKLIEKIQKSESLRFIVNGEQTSVE